MQTINAGKMFQFFGKQDVTITLSLILSNFFIRNIENGGIDDLEDMK